MPEKPKQVDGLEITPVDDGFIIRDAARERVHYLNHAGGLALTLCDGQNTAGEMPLLLQRQLDLPEPLDGAIAAVLAQDVDERLAVVAGAPARPSDLS